MGQGILDEQVSYYRARAPEYDEWWARRGSYALAPDAALRWQSEIATVEKALEEFGAKGDVLELASGTGWWTQRLARSATTLTCVDASPEVLSHNCARLTASGLKLPRYLEADLFGWKPDRRYDVVFFSFWLSHVPSADFASFWAMVQSALKPGGRVFVLDEPAGGPYPKLETEFQQRQLNDGRRFTIVKLYYEPGELAGKLADLGWRSDFRRTPAYFFYGQATPD
jgi:demethylmenaquinone methyltransferase/2-methoxy-6-polyprenyl-1,4-benzoquinol methylase